MTTLVELLPPATPFGGDVVEKGVFAESDIRRHATEVIELFPPKIRGRDDYPRGLLAVSVVENLVSFAALRFHSGHGWRGDRIVSPPHYQLIFSGQGISGVLRELRHTDWGDGGYINYPSGPLIAEAFRHLARWFDGCWEVGQ